MKDGFKECADMFRQLDDAVQLKIVRREARKGAELIRAEQLDLVARRTGELAETIAIKTKKETPTSVTLTIGPSLKKFYARFLEFGTKFMSARPFVRPAVESKGDEAASVFANGLWVAVKKKFQGRPVAA